MLHEHRGWVFLLLILGGFCLPIIEVLVLGRERIALMQARNSEKAVIAWIMVALAPLFSYVLFRFCLVSVRTVGLFRWIARVIVCAALGLVAGHVVAYPRVAAVTLAVALTQLLAGVGALQACQDVERHSGGQVHGHTIFAKFQMRARSFIGSRYFIALIGLANCITAGIWLRAEDCRLFTIIVGMGASLAAGMFVAAVVAWLVAKCG